MFHIVAGSCHSAVDGTDGSGGAFVHLGKKGVILRLQVVQEVIQSHIRQGGHDVGIAFNGLNHLTDVRALLHILLADVKVVVLVELHQLLGNPLFRLVG